MIAYQFDDTGEAYDATQCRDELAANGHALVIPSEGVVGLSYTWPVAVTRELGKLHGLATGTKADELMDMGKQGRVWSDEAITLAVRYALDLGLELDPGFEGFAEAARALPEPPPPAPLGWAFAEA